MPIYSGPLLPAKHFKGHSGLRACASHPQMCFTHNYTVHRIFHNRGIDISSHQGYVLSRVLLNILNFHVYIVSRIIMITLQNLFLCILRKLDHVIDNNPILSEKYSITISFSLLSTCIQYSQHPTSSTPV